MSAFSEYAEPAMRVLSLSTPQLSNALYPMEYMTKLHKGLHVKGFTHAWVDSLSGPYHRILHGHDLLADGYKVLVSNDLKFGEFLHHLGCDFLSKTGVPIPGLSKMLVDSGLSQAFVSEFFTFNVPKILGGSLSVIVSGCDVWAMFSDTIPHTFGSAAFHGAGALAELAIGCFLCPNPLLIVSGAAEAVVSAVTFYRAWTEPIVESLGVSLNAYIGGLGAVLPLAAAFAAGGCVLSGRSLGESAQVIASALVAQGVAHTVGCMTAGGALSSVGAGVGAVLGPAAGLTAYLLAMKGLERLGEAERRRQAYFAGEARRAVSDWSAASNDLHWGDSPDCDWRNSPGMSQLLQPTCHSGLALPALPIGSLKNGKLILNDQLLRSFN